MTHLPAALLAVLWLWMDFTGLLLSVISTYFYFGWEGVPNRVIYIFLIAVFAFSGPVCVGLLKRFIPQEILLKALLGLQFGMYILLMLIREPDFFAWGVVAGSWISGMAFMAIMANFKYFLVWSLPFYTLMISYLFYLSVRINNMGLAMLFEVPSLSRGNYIPWLIMFTAVLGGLFLPASRQLPQPQDTPAEGSDKPPNLGVRAYGLILGLLIGMGLGLVYNLHIWSAKTPDSSAAVYFISLTLATLLSWLLFTRLPHRRLPLLGLSGLTLGAGLYVILYQPFDLSLGLLMHGAACFGLGYFWQVYLYRYGEWVKRWPDYFPITSFQIGFVAFLVILAIFLLHSNPNGFWIALGLSLMLLLWTEYKAAPIAFDRFPLTRLWLFSFVCFFLPGFAALAFPRMPEVTDPPGKTLRVMSSNIRFGWTDDYRFYPQLHLNYLKNQNADIIGFQEVNKGHTSGAYMDLFRFYEAGLPGYWRYGDANFGFGNALMSRYPILQSEVRTYQAKDILRRSCLITTLEIQGQTVDIYTTHLSHIAPPNPVRIAQIKELAGWLKTSSRPWILVGDFNAEPGSEELQILLDAVPPFFKSQPELFETPSFSSLDPRYRIDYIFFSQHFQLVKADILDNQGSSDHKPVYMELELKPQQP